MLSTRVVWMCLMVVACITSIQGQTVIAFQGAEPGDSWAYTASGASSIALSEAQSAANYTDGTQSIVMGGLSGGGSCMSGGTGNGQSISNVITFSAVDVSTSTNFTRELTFNFGNRFPDCGGTGFDAGENLVITPMFNGVAQAPITVFTGSNNAILDIQQTSYSYSIPPCVTSFAFELQINLNRDDEFLFVDDVSLYTPGFNAAPVLECWETQTFNSTTNTCETTGTQPLPPVVECWQSTSFNSATCSWDITGTQPQQPIAVNCWDDYQLDNTLCQWINIGSQPAQPPNVNCWDDYQFDATLCAWVNQGSQPQQPAALNCWDAFVFNVGSCQWDNTGTQPVAPTNLECGLTAVFNETSCAWDLTPIIPQPTPTNCWDDYIFNTTLCSWENIGAEPEEPAVACYETAVFNTTICSWEVLGTQPAVPATACYETASFNEASCSWEVTGTQPEEPTVACYETATFNNFSCAWDVNGVPFAIQISPFSLSDFAPWSTTFSLLATNDVASYEWYLDAELVSTTETFDHIFSDAGEYNVLVSAVSSGGCEATDTLTLTLQPFASQLIIPSCFTPNFDGINDLFAVEAEHLSSFEMLIYNRWGELLYQTNSLLPGWRGFSDNGYSYPDGVYEYRISATGKDGQVYQRTGGVMLIR